MEPNSFLTTIVIGIGGICLFFIGVFLFGLFVFWCLKHESKKYESFYKRMGITPPSDEKLVKWAAEITKPK